MAPEPLEISPSEEFDGVDGPWSTFPVKFGRTPGQYKIGDAIRLLPSTSLAQTYVISANGCDMFKTTSNSTSGCEKSRGRLYDPKLFTNSSQFIETDITNFMVFSAYGFRDIPVGFVKDSAAFGHDPSSNVPGVPIPIGKMSDSNFTWLGLLGIDPQVTNFTVEMKANNGELRLARFEQPSILQNLKASGRIPSLSWSYHAGSKNVDPGGDRGYGSLIMGGWDSKRMKDGKRLEYNFHEDPEKTVSLRTMSIALGSADQPTQQLLRKTVPGFATRIDSTRPYLYLPQEACDAIAKQLQLNWDRVSQHYLISLPVHDALLQRNPFLEFELAPLSSAYDAQPNKIDSSTTQKIRISYKSLHLDLKYPRITNDSLYFPMKNASSPEQYVLGRAFLQETYLISNYERKSFTVGEIDWSKIKTSGQNSQSSIQSISPGSLTRPAYLCSGPGCGGHLGRLQIIGIAIGVSGFITMLVVLFFCWRRRSRKNKSLKDASKDNEAEELKSAVEIDTELASPDSPFGTLLEMDSTEKTIAELETKQIIEMPDTAGTLAGYYKEVELDGSSEIAIFEMEGSPVSPDKKQSPPPPAGNGTSSSQLSGSSGEGSFLGPLPNRLEVVRIGNRGAPQYPASPIPKTPQEYYGRHARRRFGFSSVDIQQSQQQHLNAILAAGETEQDDRPPASAIPQTPAEYYGGRLPAHRQQQIQAAKIEVTAPPEESTAVKSAPDETKESGGGLQVPWADVRGRGDEMHASGNRSPGSPIPQTPLEMYGQVPASVGTAEQRRWLGRAPTVPSVTLVPPTPSSPSAPAVPLRSAAREMRPPEKSPETSQRERENYQGDRRKE